MTRRCRNNSSCEGNSRSSIGFPGLSTSGLPCFFFLRRFRADPEVLPRCNPYLAACAARRVLPPFGQSPCPKHHRISLRTSLGSLSRASGCLSTFRIPSPCGREPPRRPIVGPFRPVSSSPRRRAALAANGRASPRATVRVVFLWDRSQWDHLAALGETELRRALADGPLQVGIG